MSASTVIAPSRVGKRDEARELAPPRPDRPGGPGGRPDSSAPEVEDTEEARDRAVCEPTGAKAPALGGRPDGEGQ